jgi:hypothetical protein
MRCYTAYCVSAPSVIGPRRSHMSSISRRKPEITRGDSFRHDADVFWSAVEALGVCLARLCYICLASRVSDITQPVSPSGVSWLVRLKLNGARRCKCYQ